MNDRTRDNYDLNQLSHPAQAIEAAPIVWLNPAGACSSAILSDRIAVRGSSIERKRVFPC